jgi:hypothetical protein
MESTPLHVPPWLHRLFNNSSVFTSFFWMVVVCWFANWWQINSLSAMDGRDHPLKN